MPPLKLVRDTRPDARTAFLVQAFGVRQLADGSQCDFDDFYHRKLAPAFDDMGMALIRADLIYGHGDVADTAWHGLQSASLVLVDFTLQRPNVCAEFALALALGKRIIVMTQDPDDIPSDVAGHYRYLRYSFGYKDIDRLLDELRKEVPAIMEQPASEMSFVPLPGSGGTTPVPGKVVHVDKECAMVLTDDGRRVVLGSADVDYRRLIPDMARRFRVGERVQGAFEVDWAGTPRYTLLAGQINPWPALEARMPPGTTVKGTVDRVMVGVGLFVHIGQGVNGLIPETKLMGTLPQVGEEIEVEITSLDTAARRVGLRMRAGCAQPRSLQTSTISAPPAKVGDIFDAEVVCVRPEHNGRGGYILLMPEGWRKTVMLHCSQMTPELRRDLNAKDIDIGELLHVEVTRIEGNRVFVKNRPDLDDLGTDPAAA